ncbi:MAG: hypothetical protein JNL58_30205 [Planctomyces sp.]|nr:hypothetical protein [Planctomyces sp.]
MEPIVADEPSVTIPIPFIVAHGVRMSQWKFNSVTWPVWSRSERKRNDENAISLFFVTRNKNPRDRGQFCHDGWMVGRLGLGT